MELTDEQFNAFECIARDYGDVTTDYSGRGMFGESCVGIDGDGKLMSKVARLFVDLGKSELEIAIVEKLARCVSSDNMGKNGWIVYFPGVSYGEYEGGNREDEQEDEETEE